jgi:hypothetical protein
MRVCVCVCSRSLLRCCWIARRFDFLVQVSERAAYLEFLRDCGLDGLHSFLSMFTDVNTSVDQLPPVTTTTSSSSSTTSHTLSDDYARRTAEGHEVWYDE